MTEFSLNLNNRPERDDNTLGWYQAANPVIRLQHTYFIWTCLGCHWKAFLSQANSTRFYRTPLKMGRMDKASDCGWTAPSRTERRLIRLSRFRGGLLPSGLIWAKWKCACWRGTAPLGAAPAPSLPLILYYPHIRSVSLGTLLFLSSVWPLIRLD